MLQYYNCEDYFIIRFHLIPLISGQKIKKNFIPLTKQAFVCFFYYYNLLESERGVRCVHPLAITLFGWLIDWSGASAPLVRSSSSHRIAVDLPNGRHGAPNGGVAAAGAEETVVWMKKKKQVELVREAIHGLLEERRRRGHGEDNGLASSQQQLQLQEEEEGLLSSLLTKVLYILCVWIVSDCRV